MLSSCTLIFKPKSFFKLTVSTIALLAIFHIVYFEIYARKLAVEGNVDLERYYELMSHGERFHVAAIGTSHTNSGLLSNSSSFFNYGRMFTWYPQVATAKVAHLINYAPKLQVLLLEIDHLDLFKYNSSKHLTLPKIHSHLWKEGVGDMNWQDSLTLVSFQGDVAPGIHKRFIQEKMKINAPKKNHNQQGKWFDLADNIKRDKAAKRVKGQLLQFPQEIDDKVYQYYASSILMAKQRNIDLYLILFPQTEEYFNAIHPENHEKLEKFIALLGDKYGVKLLDYRFSFRNDEQLFSNQDHLNRLGAKILIKKVFDDISESVE